MMHFKAEDIKNVNDSARHLLSEYYFRIQICVFSEENNFNGGKDYYPFKEELLIVCQKGTGVIQTKNERITVQENDQVFLTEPFKVVTNAYLMLELIWSPGLYPLEGR